MKLVLPDDLSILSRPFAENGQWLLSLGVCAFFDLTEGASGGLRPGREMWAAIESALGEGEVFDAGLPKPRGEFLVYGSACAPQPVTALEVGVRVGALSKTLKVQGDRVWGPGGLPTPPQPFTRLRVCHASAWGGPGVAENPLGKGAVADATGVQPLPNVLAADQVARGPRERLAPVGLTAYPLTWPQRTRHLGPIDRDYLSLSWPGFPRGTSPDYLLTAPEDQWLPAFFRGDEALEVHHMHPTRDLLRASLPAVRPRLFVNRRVADQERFEEVPCRAETLWLFPDLERAVLLHRGLIPVADEECEDLLHLFAFWEPLEGTPATLDACHQRFLKELSPDAPVPDAGPAPGPTPAPEPAPQPEPTPVASAPAAGTEAALDGVMTELKALESQVADLLKGLGLDPEAVMKSVPAPPPETLAPDPAPDLDALLADLDRQCKELMTRFNLDEQAVSKFLEAQPTPAPPTFDQIIGQLRAAGVANPELEAQLREADAALGELTALVGGLAAPKPDAPPEPPPSAAPEPGPPSPSSAAGLTRERVLAMHANGEPLVRLDLTGLDLTGADLSGADLSGSVLEAVAFRGANLARCRFAGAILIRADLGGADLRGAELQGVQAARAMLAGARLGGADLTQGDFTGADLTGADLEQATLTGALFEQATLVGARAAAVRAPKAGFMGADLSRAVLAGADLEDADLSGATLVGADLTGARAPGLRLHGVRGDRGTCLKSAVLGGSRADGESSLAGVDLTGADLRRACWAGADLTGANLTEARLDSADLSHARLVGAILRRAQARGLDLTKADLGQADLTAIDLFQGSLRRARLGRTVLRSSNLYGVDLYQARLGETDLAGANLNRTLLDPRLVR